MQQLNQQPVTLCPDSVARFYNTYLSRRTESLRCTQSVCKPKVIYMSPPLFNYKHRRDCVLIAQERLLNIHLADTGAGPVKQMRSFLKSATYPGSAHLEHEIIMLRSPVYISGHINSLVLRINFTQVARILCCLYDQVPTLFLFFQLA